MAEVTVQVNGRSYQVGCQDGQEQHVLALARMFDRHVAQVARDVGQLGETRLFLLAALLLADELSELRATMDATSSDLAKVRGDTSDVARRAVQALEAAADRIEALAAKAV